jgi:ABC-type glycerol-3-phosphate transport system substrate-binding protein
VSLALACLLTAIAACQPAGQPAELIRPGRLRVWHNWMADGSLEAEIQRFVEFNPHVRVVIERVPSKDLDRLYMDEARAGLGPDLLIGYELYELHNLVGADLIADLSPHRIEASGMLTSAMNALGLGAGLYGLPFMASINVLFYNRTLVADSQVPASASGLLDEARAGRKVALPIDFYHSYWGITAFGGRLLDDRGRMVLNPERFQAWLDWLVEACAEPNVTDGAYEEMLQVFKDGRAAYFIGESSALPELRAALGEDGVGVARLPSAETASKAILEPHVFALNRATSRVDLAMSLIDYLLSDAVQRRLALTELGLLPVNTGVYIDPASSQSAAVMIAESDTAFIINPLAYMEQVDQMRAIGDLMYMRTLDGSMAAADASAVFVEAMRRVFNP